MSPLGNKNRNRQQEKVLIVGIYRDSRQIEGMEASLEELESLIETAGGVVVSRVTGRLIRPHPATFIGQGKIDEVIRTIDEKKIHTVIFDHALTPTQHRNLERQCKIKILDRTGLILDIFATRARSMEGKLQVELAQMQYLLPRLVRGVNSFSRLGGGIGTRGPGETQLEIDRRRVREKIATIKKALLKVRSNREIHRERRRKVPIAMISLIGYTNAGKSTLMNAMTHAGVLVEDKLFATLDPTVRRIKLPSAREVLIADTVGFVRNLPHELVESFYATFEEMASSDLLLHVIDASHPQSDAQIQTIEKVLVDLKLDDRPVLSVYNKIDKNGETSPAHDAVAVSALRGTGIMGLLEAIERKLSETWRRVTLLLPHGDGSSLSQIYRTCRVLKRKDLKKGVRLEVEMGEKYLKKFDAYQVVD